MTSTICANAVFHRLDDGPRAMPGCSKDPPVSPLRKGGKVGTARTFPPLRRGGWGGDPGTTRRLGPAFPPLRRGGWGGESAGACDPAENSAETCHGNRRPIARIDRGKGAVTATWGSIRDGTSTTAWD